MRADVAPLRVDAMSNSAGAPAARLVCAISDLVPGAGVGARLGETQVALFHLPEETPAVYAIGNHDPIGGANVLSRGIVGDLGGELVVASPLYKQHFSLVTGRCLEDDAVAVPVFRVLVSDGYVYLVP
ncbi:MAG: nitrite reductase small subunit NirD [Pseudomonadales bacterium]|jgi:nitrite reductase (NADH) small subunit